MPLANTEDWLMARLMSKMNQSQMRILFELMDWTATDEANATVTVLLDDVTFSTEKPTNHVNNTAPENTA